MAIYPDKKGGALNGRWRVELQRGKERYRKRWDAHADAVADEKAVLTSWDAGEALPAPGEAPGAPERHTFATVIPLAEGMLWSGQRTEAQSWQRLKVCAAIIGINTKLDAVDTHAIDQVIKTLRARGKADGTINRHVAHLAKFLRWSKDRKYRTVPITDIKFDTPDESEGRIRWLSDDEETTMGAYLLSRNRDEATAVWELIQVALETGARRDELLTARPDQVLQNRLHLWGPDTKTKSSRTVPMRPETSKLLMGLITSGRMPSRRGLRSWWERARVEMGLAGDPDFVFHACRHTCATRMVDAGVNILVIQKWLGHKVIQTTLRYAHVRPENLEEALVKVGNLRLAHSGEPQNTATFTPPHPTPTPGGIQRFSKAA